MGRKTKHTHKEAFLVRRTKKALTRSRSYLQDLEEGLLRDHLQTIRGFLKMLTFNDRSGVEGVGQIMTNADKGREGGLANGNNNQSILSQLFQSFFSYYGHYNL